VSVSVTGLSREQDEPMSAATHWHLGNVLRRPAAVEGRSNRDICHSETHFASSAKWRMARPTPFETKRKKAPIGALGRIQCLNVAVRKGLQSNLLHALAHQNSALRFIKNLRDPEFPVSRRKIGYCVEPFAH
jgi:hypothetical protein